jgi:LPS O-antigen subunit length determinant protein (WzzB/FepE family)
MGEACWK